jgi:WD40 repeat protein
MLRVARNGQPYNGLRPIIWNVAFSPDGRWLAASNNDNSISLWDAATLKDGATWRGPGQLRMTVFSPDGKTLAAGHINGAVALWDVAAGKKQATILAHEGIILGVAFSPDGKTLVTTGIDRAVRIWRVSAVAQDSESGAEERPRLQGHRLIPLT